MSTLSDNPDREELREHYESGDDAPTECWHNYGDANPAPHGGQWVHYDREWDLRATFVAKDIGYPMDEHDVEEPIKAQYVYASECHWSDIVTEDGEWTDAAQSTVNTLANGHDSPAGAVVDGRMTWFVVAFMDDHRRDYRRDKPVYTGDYADILDAVGVDPCPDDL